MDEKPLISVLMPTFNRAQYIEQAIDSVLVQDYRPLELVIVDDGSTDGTSDIVGKYDKNIVKYFYQENSGCPVARNACLAHALGEYVAWIDSDDYYLPGKLSTQMNYMLSHPECEIVFAGYEFFFENAKYLNYRNFHRNKQGILFSLAKKTIYSRAGFYPEDQKIHSDLALMLRMQFEFGIDFSHYIDIVFYMFRKHDEELTSDENRNPVLTREILFKNIRKKLEKEEP